MSQATLDRELLHLTTDLVRTPQIKSRLSINEKEFDIVFDTGCKKIVIHIGAQFTRLEIEEKGTPIMREGWFINLDPREPSRDRMIAAQLLSCFIMASQPTSKDHGYE